MRIKGRLLDNFKRSISIVILVIVTMVFLSGIAVQTASGEKITITWWYETILDKELAPLALELGRYMGEIYSLPKTFESMGLVYNKTLFEKNGWKSPTNREEWEALCNAIKAKDILPVSLGNADWRATNEWFVTVYLNHYAGPENVYKALTGQLAWDNSLFVEAIEMLKQDFLNYWPRPDVYFSLSFSDAVPLIATGKAAMMVVGSWAFQWVGDPGFWPSDDQWEWEPFPSLRGCLVIKRVSESY